MFYGTSCQLLYFEYENLSIVDSYLRVSGKGDTRKSITYKTIFVTKKLVSLEKISEW